MTITKDELTKVAEQLARFEKENGTIVMPSQDNVNCGSCSGHCLGGCNNFCTQGCNSYCDSFSNSTCWKQWGQCKPRK